MAESQASVLVVDDDVAVGSVLAALLKQDGFEATFVPNALVALATLEKRRAPPGLPGAAGEGAPHDLPWSVRPACRLAPEGDYASDTCADVTVEEDE